MFSKCFYYQYIVLILIFLGFQLTLFYCKFGLFPEFSISHYENLLMQYTEKIFGRKNENFQCTNFDIFLIFAQNIDCGYTLEPPR